MGGSSRPGLRVARGAPDEGLQEAVLAPLRRSSGGSITAILEWLHYADLRLAPLRRSRNGSIGAVADTTLSVMVLSGLDVAAQLSGDGIACFRKPLASDALLAALPRATTDTP